MHDAHRRGGRCVAPQVVDEPVGAARDAVVDEQGDEQRAQLRRFRVDPHPVAAHLEGSEERKAQRRGRPVYGSTLNPR